jgi:Sigma-70, region 4/Helix-turn-helix domain
MPRRFPLRGRGLRKPTLYTFGEPELVDLDERTAHVLCLRSGMWDGLLYSLDEVGKSIGISRERVRQIESTGLYRIQRLREAQRHLREEPKKRRQSHLELQSASRRKAGPYPPATPAPVSDSPFPGWEQYVASFVHPLKVAIVEALCWMGDPLSVVQLTKLCSGESFREPNVRYHLHKLVEAGVLEIVSTNPFDKEGDVDMSFYFPTEADQVTQGCPPARVPKEHK